ncbi:MAG: carbon-nitrogen hydrolase family protein [Hyphomicrobiales bacterium]
MSGEPFKVGLVQMRSGVEPERNIADALGLIAEAATAGARFVSTPEMTNVMDSRRAVLVQKVREEKDDPAVAAFAEAARTHGIHLLVGSLALKHGDKLVNRSLLFTPEGAIAARYDKIHLFDVDLPNGDVYRESATYDPGAAAVTAELPWGTLGMTVCYDVRFPHLYRSLAQSGATFLSVPAAFTRITGEAHWHVLLRARAIESGAFVFAAAQGGRHENGRETFGHSLVISPWGEVIAEAGTDPCVIVADIDPALSAEARARVPSLRHDRPYAAPGLEQEPRRRAS